MTIPFDPNDPMYLWWEAWRDHIRNAKRYPERSLGYCQAAVIAQSEYEMARAVAVVKGYR